MRLPYLGALKSEYLNFLWIHIFLIYKSHSCKKILIQESTNFAQNHVISNNDDSISITTNLHETRTHNSRSMYSHNDSNHKFSNRRSVSASRQSFGKDSNKTNLKSFL